MPAGALDLIGKLQSGGRSANHEHAAVVELGGIAVVLRSQRPQTLRQGCANRRHSRHVVRAACDDNGEALPLTAVCHHAVPVVVCAD